MKIYTIEQKMSNSGSIHDIASELEDRQIKFPERSKYAVVLAAYYGGKGYTTHRSIDAVLRQAHKVKDYSCSIIDIEGHNYANLCDDIERIN